jgi:putative RNA 2'-phosphotransferase
MKPQQLAKILRTITVVNPAEYGLFWDKDGSMPWKEFLWALQRQEELRFVRESHIKEIELSGLDLPFFLEEGRLRLKTAPPTYPAVTPPERLFIAIPLRGVPFVQKKGILVPSNRSYIALWSDPQESIEMMKPSSDEKPVVLTVNTESLAGHSFYKAGERLFLTDSPLPPDCLVIPPVSEKELEALREIKKEKAQREKAKGMTGTFHIQPLSQKEKAAEGKMSGSFMLTVEAFKKQFGMTEDTPGKKSEKKKSKGPDWKREARKIRKTKRTI